MTLHDILTMHGYGIYVWPTYGLTLSLFFLQWFFAKREKIRIHTLIQQIGNRSE